MQSPMQVEGHTGAAEPPRWSLATKIAFRFACVFFPLYNLWVWLQFIPIPSITSLNHSFWDMVVNWTAAHVLRVHLVYSPLNSATGSKDTTANYVQVLCYFAVVGAVTLIWSLLDRKRPKYERLYDWFRLYLRLTLAAIMIPYGAVKVFPTQFPAPSLSTLLEPYGYSSPMSLLWVFMGASPLYTFFAGAVEVLGGALLVVPRLTLLGALISAAAMVNVLMLNLGYDVPVKLFTFNLVVMAGLLILPDLRRLASFFVLNRRVEPAVTRPLFKRARLNQIALVLQLLFGIGLLSVHLYTAERHARRIVDARTDSPLCGIWSVEQFTADGQVRPPLLTDPLRWRRIIIESHDRLVVQSMSDQPQFFRLNIDPNSKSLSIQKPEDWLSRADFTYDNPRSDALTLKGRMDGHDIAVTFRRFDESQFVLTNRGFHWINEYSYVR